MPALAKATTRETPTRQRFRAILTAIGGDGGFWKPEKITAVKSVLDKYTDAELRTFSKEKDDEQQHQNLLTLVGATRKQFVREIIKAESSWLTAP